MKKIELSKLFVSELNDSRSKTLKVEKDIIKYLTHKGYKEGVISEMEKRCGHPCNLQIFKEKRKVRIMNTDSYITKSTLKKRWSERLISLFFSEPTLELDNPYYSCASSMCLYSMSKIERIEKTEEFKKEYRKTLLRRNINKYKNVG